MAKKKNTIFEDIIKDIDNYANNVAKFCAIEAKDRLTATVSDAINQFYDDYEPEVYARHYYNFEKKSFKPYYHNNHGKVFTGGVTLTPEAMDELYYNGNWGTSAENVFNTVYSGWHGLPNDPYTGIPQMKPSPMELINREYKKILKDASLIERAEKKASTLLKYI